MENAGFPPHGVTSAVQPSLPEAAKLARGNVLFLSVVDVVSLCSVPCHFAFFSPECRLWAFLFRNCLR